MPSLFDEVPWWTTADTNNALSRERDKKLPVRSSFFNALVPQVSAKDAAINRPDPVERASMLPFATYPDGSTKLALPGMIAEDIPRAVTAPARAYRGEIPDEDMISEGLNFAGNMAIGGSAVPKPSNAAGMFGGRLAKTADVASEAARQPRPVQMEVPFYRGSAHGQTAVNYDQPFWGTTDKNLASDYAKSRSEMYFRDGTTPNVAPAVGRFRNPLYIDAQNAGWSDIPFEGQKWNSDKLAETAKQRGHDGLVIDHLYDEGKYDPAAGLPATVAALRPGTVSSAFDPNTILYGNGQSASAPGLIAAEAADKPRVQNPIRAYHGSPHDFDRFDLSKIGSGEGAQAFGHGLYFAENEGVAKSYRDALAGQKLSDGSMFNDASPAHQAAAYVAGTKSKEEAIAALVDDIAMSQRQHDGAHAQRLMRAKGMLERGEPIPTLNNGKMYEVNIHADPNDFLDWDAPISKQSEKVRELFNAKLKNGGIETRSIGKHNDGTELVDVYQKGGGSFGVYPRDKVQSVIDRPADYYPHATGKDLKENLGLSEDVLREAGIPGIKYLDQGSRTAGEGSRNYVAFDADLIEILRKYMNPQTAVAPGVLMVEGAKDGRRQ